MHLAEETISDPSLQIQLTDWLTDPLTHLLTGVTARRCIASKKMHLAEETVSDPSPAARPSLHRAKPDPGEKSSRGQTWDGAGCATNKQTNKYKKQAQQKYCTLLQTWSLELCLARPRMPWNIKNISAEPNLLDVSHGRGLECDEREARIYEWSDAARGPTWVRGGIPVCEQHTRSQR